MAAGRGRAHLQLLKQTEQCRRRIADGDQGTVEPVTPKIERGGRTGGAELGGKLWH